MQRRAKLSELVRTRYGSKKVSFRLQAACWQQETRVGTHRIGTRLQDARDEARGTVAPGLLRLLMSESEGCGERKRRNEKGILFRDQDGRVGVVIQD